MALKLTSKEHLIDNVWAFRFEAEPAFSWEPGQFIRVELPHDNSDDEGTKRWFTISSAPYEKIIQITTRVTDSTFKQALSRLEVGDESLQLIDEPSGDFVWEDSDLPIIFVAGGIGVTPFYSILKQRQHDGLPLKATLIYGSRTDQVPFKDELKTWSQQDPRLEVRYEVGEPFTAQRLQKIVPNLNQSLIYLSGPELMVDAVGDDLIREGLPVGQLKQDFFPNYSENNY